MVRRTGFLLVLLLFPLSLLAQSPVSAVGGEAGIWVGGEMSSFNPDWSCPDNNPFACGSNQLIGPTALFDFNARSRWGAEGEARWLHWHGFNGQTQADYLIGPRYEFYQHDRFNFWAKFEMGGGWITTGSKMPYVKGSYFVYAPGATVDYHLNRRFSVRGDYEYQFWPSFVGLPTLNGTTFIQHNHGLTPNGFSLGVAYRFLGQ
jgi:hypothetical protein